MLRLYAEHFEFSPLVLGGLILISDVYSSSQQNRWAHQALKADCLPGSHALFSLVLGLRRQREVSGQLLLEGFLSKEEAVSSFFRVCSEKFFYVITDRSTTIPGRGKRFILR